MVEDWIVNLNFEDYNENTAESGNGAILKVGPALRTLASTFFIYSL